MFSNDKSIAVIGLGTFGLSLARSLTEKGVRVVGVDHRQPLVDRHHAELDNTIMADATDPRALKECALDDQDVVIVAIGANVEANLLATQNAKTLGAKRLFSKSQSDTQTSILNAIGVDAVLTPEVDEGRRMAEAMFGLDAA